MQVLNVPLQLNRTEYIISKYFCIRIRISKGIAFCRKFDETQKKYHDKIPACNPN